MTEPVPSDLPSHSATIPLDGLGKGRWGLDPIGSSVDFRHKTMWGLVGVNGSFTHFGGTADLGPDGSLSCRLEIFVDSLTTKNKKRDEHLRSADFFDVTQHPYIVFTLEGATGGETGLVVSGSLEVAGTKKTLQFPVSFVERSGDVAVVEANLTVNREDFGLDWNKAGMITGTTKLSVRARFIRESVD